MFSFPVDDDIELRLHEKHHAEALFALIDGNRDHLRRWFPWEEQTRDVDDTLQFIKGVRQGYADNEAIPTGVWFKGHIAGTLSLFDINWDVGSGEIGYWLGAGYEGRGIITRSCRALIRYAFETLDLNRIVICCRPDNRRSSAVAKRLAFTHEGTLRQYARHGDKLHDREVYSLLRCEWESAADI